MYYNSILNKIIVKIFLSLTFLLVITFSAKATIYYSTTVGGTVGSLTNWSTNADGTGTNPSNFTSGDIFIIQSVMTTSTAWTISGTNAEVRLNSGSLTITSAITTPNFTVNGGTLTFSTNDITISGGAWTYNSGIISNVSRTVFFTGASTIGGSGAISFYKIQISSGSTTTLSNFSVINTFTNNATFIASTDTVFFAGITTLIGSSETTTSFANVVIDSSNSLTLNNSTTISIYGSFINNGTFKANTSSTVMFGTVGNIGGTSATFFNNLTINTTDSSALVSLTKSGGGINGGGTLTITKGIFKIGAGNAFNLGATSGTGGTVTITVAGGTVGNFANSTDGKALDKDQDGGTIIMGSNIVTSVTVNGAAIFNNISTNSSGGSLLLSNNSIRIDGIFRIATNNFNISGNSPIWGSNSTLYLVHNGQGYTPGIEWKAIASGTGTIGVTPGYPNNVTITNVGISMGLFGGVSVGFAPSGNWSINGTLAIGDSANNGKASISTMSSFSCGGIIIDNNSTLVGASFTDYGNWRRQGNTVIGNYVNIGSGTVSFKHRTSGILPQTISVISGAETQLNNIILDSANTYVVLNSPLTLSATATLNLANGILQSSITNILSISNTSASAISGGSSTSFINGPVKWSLLNAGNNSYKFPVGSGTSYLPLTLNSTNTTPGNIAIAQAFKANSGGVPDNTTVNIIDTSVYWSMATSASLGATTSTVSISQSSPISPYDIIGSSSTANGTYSIIGGNTSTNTATSGQIGSSSPWYFTFCQAKNKIYLALPATINICPIAVDSLPATVDVPVTVKDFTSIIGFQGSINWDSTVVKYNTISYTAPGLGLSVANFNLFAANTLSFSWFDNLLTGKTLSDSSILFTIRFNIVKTAFGKKSFVQFISIPTNIEATQAPSNNIAVLTNNGSINIMPAIITNTQNLNGCDSVIYNGIKYTHPLVLMDTVRNTSGCDSVYNVTNINVGPSPIINIDSITYNNPVLLGDTIQLTVNGENLQQATFNWTGPNGFTSSALNPAIINATIAKKGLYKLIASNTCSIDSATLNVKLYAAVSGSVVTPVNAVIPTVTLSENRIPTTVSGNYNLILNTDSSLTLSASKNNDVNKTNGVSVIDIVLIQNHILQKVLLNTPYKIIAADVNSSGDISTLDLIYMKRLILGLDTSFPGNKLWAFVDSNYIFPTPANPFPFKDSITFFNLSSNQVNKSFIGIKLGDVNYDWSPAILRPTTEAKPVEFYYNNIQAEQEDEIKIPIRVKNFNDILGVQFTLNFNSNVFTFKGIENNKLKNVQFATNHSNEGKISFIWVDEANNTITLPDDSVVMELVFTKKTSFNEEDISITSDITENETWDVNYTKNYIIKGPGKILGTNAFVTNDKEFWEVNPNPSHAIINVKYNLLQAKNIQFELWNADGKSVLIQNIQLPVGENICTLDLQKTKGLPSGVYYLKANGIDNSNMKKIVLLK